MNSILMDEYYRNDDLKPDKPFDPLEAGLEQGKMKHCDLFNRCLDNCKECIFNDLYHLNPQPWEDPNVWSYWDLADNEY